MKSSRLNQWPKHHALPLLAALLVSGCFGGTVAQQLARSLFMHGADKATAAAVEAHERNENNASRYLVPNNTKLDDYQIAFLRSGFEVIRPKVESLPTTRLEAELPEKMIRESKLVNVEVWSLLIGDEKKSLLQKAMIQGSQLLSPEQDWPVWQVAIGESVDFKNRKKHEPIIFLIPPDIVKIRTGGKALVELPNNGELNIARYTIN